MTMKTLFAPNGLYTLCLNRYSVARDIYMRHSKSLATRSVLLMSLPLRCYYHLISLTIRDRLTILPIRKLVMFNHMRPYNHMLRLKSHRVDFKWSRLKSLVKAHVVCHIEFHCTAWNHSQIINSTTTNHMMYHREAIWARLFLAWYSFKMPQIHWISVQSRAESFISPSSSACLTSFNLFSVVAKINRTQFLV